MEHTQAQYKDFKKPSWSPPAWIFGPVWTFLYILIVISFGYIFIQYFKGTITTLVALPFLLNILFNIAYTPIQFRLRNFTLAMVDILLVLATLLWAIISIYPLYHWVAYINIPYLAWVSFATVLQITITYLNKNEGGSLN